MDDEIIEIDNVERKNFIRFWGKKGAGPKKCVRIFDARTEPLLHCLVIFLKTLSLMETNRLKWCIF